MRPPLSHSTAMHDDITISRSRHDIIVVLAITGWGLALFLIGVLIGGAK